MMVMGLHYNSLRSLITVVMASLNECSAVQGDKVSSLNG